MGFALGSNLSKTRQLLPPPSHSHTTLTTVTLGPNNKRQNMNPVISFLVQLKKIIQPTARKLRVSQESFDKLSNFDVLLTQSLTDKMNVLGLGKSADDDRMKNCKETNENV